MIKLQITDKKQCIKLDDKIEGIVPFSVIIAEFVRLFPSDHDRVYYKYRRYW